MGFGALWRPGNAVRTRGFELILERPRHPGSNHIMDWVAQLPGVNVDRLPGTGTAVLSRNLNRATFSLDIEGSTKTVTGNWRCA